MVAQVPVILVNVFCPMNKNIFIRTLVFLACFLAASSVTLRPVLADYTPNKETALDRTIRLGQDNLLVRQIEKNHWDFPSYLGTQYISQYYLFLNWLDDGEITSKTKLDRDLLRKHLRIQHNRDGGWKGIDDANLPESNLDAMVLNYWALKVIGQPDD